MSIELPILNCNKPCIVAREQKKWFEGKELMLDEKGYVFYRVDNGKKYYEYDQPKQRTYTERK